MFSVWSVDKWKVVMLKYCVLFIFVFVGCLLYYSVGWVYVDWWLFKGGLIDVDFLDGWYVEKYEGWWDCLVLVKFGLV